jgi:hypothetical protein
MSSDPSIRDWKQTDPSKYPPTWPWAMSADIYVDNNGNRQETTVTNPPNFRYHLNVNESGEPEKGRSDNRLFAWVRNLGSDPANNVIVEFLYCPYGLVGGVNPYLHFKQIAVVTVSLGSATNPGPDPAEKEVEVWWDLSDLTETNGGVWPAPISAFDHFCVRVNVYNAADSNPTNNVANNNFVNVLSASAFSPMPFLVANSESEPMPYEISARTLPKDWILQIRGLEKDILKIGPDKTRKFKLKPGEARYLTLTVIPKEKAEIAGKIVDIVMIAKGEPVGGISMTTHKRIPGRKFIRPSAGRVSTLLHSAPAIATIGGRR